MPEVLHDPVERRRHRRQGREPFDQRVAPRDRLPAQHGVPLAVEYGPAHDVALIVGERLLKLHRERMGKELDDRLARREIHVDIVPL